MLDAPLGAEAHRQRLKAFLILLLFGIAVAMS
jgi:hypothetical protein